MISNEVLNRLILKYREKKLAHAYLIETNNQEKATEDILELIKYLNCPENFENSCTKCNLCNLTNKLNLPSLKIIDPDGTSIKKSQIETLKNEFSTIPVFSKYNVYIIRSVEKMNASSANAMLKFIEEPTPGILGFFITNNKDIILDTIKSRCQIINLNYEGNTILEKLNIDQSKYEEYKEEIAKYLQDVDKSIVINNKKTILTKFPDRKDIENMMKILFDIYYNKFLKEIGKKYDEELINIYKEDENLSIINKKIQIINNILTNLSYNVNMELILDKFVIEMRGLHE